MPQNVNHQREMSMISIFHVTKITIFQTTDKFLCLKGTFARSFHNQDKLDNPHTVYMSSKAFANKTLQ